MRNLRVTPVLAALGVTAVLFIPTGGRIIPTVEATTTTTAHVVRITRPATPPPTTTTTTTTVVHTFAPAVRVDPPDPVFTDPCDEMNHYRILAGLPQRFDDSGRHQLWTHSDGIGWRESKCSNTAISPTGCCVGYWQLSKIIFHDQRMIPLIADHCGQVTWWDVRGDSAAAKWAQACVARQLYDVDGFTPWG